MFQELIETECEQGFLYVPFSEPPFDNNRVIPLGLAVRKYSGKKRLIVDLSSPHDNPLNSRINDLIDKDSCCLTYVKLMTPLEQFRIMEEMDYYAWSIYI